VPEGENGPLAIRELSLGGIQSLLDLFGKQQTFGVRIGSGGHLQNQFFVLGRGAALPQSPAFGTEFIETSIHGDPGEPFPGVVEIVRLGALGEGAVGFKKYVLGGGIGFVGILQQAAAEQENTALFRGHPGAEIA